MTKQDSINRAIERISYKINEVCNHCYEPKNECENCSEKNYYNSLIRILVKQIPKKPSHFKYTAMKGYPKCPCCNTSGCVSDKVEINSFTLDKRVIYGGIKNNYCTECGQAIDWSVEDD